MSMTEFYYRIDKLLKEKNLSQKELSAFIGLKSSQIFSNWKQRSTIPAANIAVKIAQYLNTSVEFLITGKENNHLADENKRLQEKIKSIADIVNNK